MIVAEFEKVSYEQFENDCLSLLDITDEKIIKEAYQNIVLPKRATKGSAGYDFVTPFNLTLESSKEIKVPTGIRVKMFEGYVLHLYPRSSLGFKYHMALLNTVGIIDSDYYGAKNEGHIIIAIGNYGEKTLTLNKGDRFAQGIFLPYFLAKEEEIDLVREGGFGSTDK